MLVATATSLSSAMLREGFIYIYIYIYKIDPTSLRRKALWVAKSGQMGSVGVYFRA